VLLNFLVFWVAFRVLTVAEVRWGEVLPGAISPRSCGPRSRPRAGRSSGTLENATQVYGFFAVVIRLLSWLYLGSQVTLFAAEVNVVRTRRLWPRALDPSDLTEADRRALKQLAEVEERHEEQRVDVTFQDTRDGSS
jgi:uncharacterized BrkB/YihY/UPF0761 family membrane protein